MSISRVLLAVSFSLICSELYAVDPPPDGGYPGENTAEGEDALFSQTTGADNVAIGFNALYSNTTGFGNTASGAQALYGNTGGVNNTATGIAALYSNTDGVSNTATGGRALTSNTIGNNNTANGNYALYQNTTGSNNTANGASALQGGGVMTGSDNTATGFAALESNITGANNTANGVNALIKNTTGRNNIALGYNAGRNLTTGNSNIDIGNSGGPGESNTLRLGKPGDQTNTYIAGISGVTVAGGVGVIVDSTGHLGTVTSSARYKKNIRPMNNVSEKLLSLQPVAFQYKEELDPQGIPQFGLVAEDVAKVDPDLVARDEDGKPYTVRYEAVNAMLLNEFLKEHRKVEEQGLEIAELKAEVKELKAFQTGTH